MNNRNHAFKDITGLTFGKLTVIKYLETGADRLAKWECRCVCGNICIVSGANLRKGNTASCGCARGQSNLRHGYAQTGAIKSEWIIWAGLKKRCLDSNNQSYPNYGGRGVTVCDRWKDSFEAFLEDMGDRPSEAHTIDRIDNNKGYYKENCRWVDRKTQGRNKRNNCLIEFQGETRCLSEWAELVGLSVATLKTRLKLGWSIERALTIPLIKVRKRDSKGVWVPEEESPF